MKQHCILYLMNVSKLLISDHIFIICHVGRRLGLFSLPRLGLCGLSFKVRTIQFLYVPILSSLKNLYKNNYLKDADEL